MYCIINSILRLNDVNDTIYGVAEIKIKFLQPASEVSF
jgi:hypothetical protein